MILATMPPRSDPATTRRASRRQGLRRTCKLTLPGAVTRHVSLMDIGLDGLSFLCTQPIAPSTRCHFSFELPLGQRSVALSGMLKTIYSSFSGVANFRIGAMFIELDEASTDALHDFIDTQA